MVVRLFSVLVLFGSVACSSGTPAGNGVTCGPGTMRIGDVCEVPDASTGDAAVDAAGDSADAAIDAAIDAPPDAGSGGASEATTIGLDPAHDNVQPMDIVASPLTPRWTATLTNPPTYGPPSYPVVAGGLVFVAADATTTAQPNVRALDINTGATVWGPIALSYRATLAYDAGRLFVLEYQGKLTALDAATGTQAWSIQVQPQPFYFAPPLASGGSIYLEGVGSGGTLVAIDEQTGAVHWTVSTGGSDGCVALGNGFLYVDSVCDFGAFNPTSGASVWNHSFGCSGGGGHAPTLHGTHVWDRDSPMGSLIFESSGDVVDGTFGTTAMPAVHGGVAFYTTSYGLIAVDMATSTLRWSFAGDGQLCTSPVIAGAGGQVFIGSQSGKVYELDEATGAERSVHDIGVQLTCFDETHSIAVAEGHLLVTTLLTLVVY